MVCRLLKGRALCAAIGSLKAWRYNTEGRGERVAYHFVSTVKRTSGLSPKWHRGGVARVTKRLKLTCRIKVKP